VIEGTGAFNIAYGRWQILSCNKNFFFHGLRSKLPQLFYFSRLTHGIN
jgi:hypothetical protein